MKQEIFKCFTVHTEASDISLCKKKQQQKTNV